MQITDMVLGESRDFQWRLVTFSWSWCESYVQQPFVASASEMATPIRIGNASKVVRGG
jgi:hypothetical protein